MLDNDEDQDSEDSKLPPWRRSSSIDDAMSGRASTNVDRILSGDANSSVPDEIKRRENDASDRLAGDSTGTRADKLEKGRVSDQTDDEPDFFKQEAEKNNGKRKIRGFISRNRGKTTFGLGALALGGGSFALFAMIAGPLQLVQMSKLLQGFHFSNQEDLSDDRMMKIARYIRYRDNPEKTRLGILGNTYADKLERRMKKSGLESGYTKRLGYFDGYIIDPSNLPPGSDLSKEIRGSPGEERLKIAKHYDIPIENVTIHEGGKIKISSDGLGRFANKKLIRISLQEAGYSKVGSAIRSRIMGKRGRVDWHPLKRIDEKILETLYARLAKWNADRESKIRNGATDSPTLSADDGTGEDGKPKAGAEELDSAAKNANNVGTEDVGGNKVSGADAEVGAVRGKLAKAGAVAALVGIVCVAQSISENIDDIIQANVRLPLMRLGGEALSVGNQVITGQDVDGEQLSFLTKKLFTQKDGSWLSARSIQAERGVDQTGPDIGPEAEINSDRNPVSQVLSQIPGLSTICAVTNSIIGQVITTGIDIFTGGPLSAIAGNVIGATVGPKVLEGFTRWVAGHPLDINVAGANYGNYVNYGARLMSIDSAASSGGAALSPRQSLELKEYRIASENEARQEKGLLARLFDPTDAQSIVGSFMSEQAPDPAQNIARVASSVPSSLASIFKLPFIFNHKARAAVNYDYGFPDYGFSVAEINNDNIKNPFENEKEVVAILKGPNADEYRERAVGCFGINLEEDGTVRSTGDVPAYHKMADFDCGDPKLEWLRIRFYILDSQLMEAYACYEDGADNSCSEFGLDGSGGSSSNATSAKYVDPSLYIPDCSANGGNAEIACTAISQLLGLPYSNDIANRPSAKATNPQFAECSSFTNMALYRATGFYTNQVSVSYRTNTTSFKEIDVHSIQAGDFVGRGSVSGGNGGNGHIGIVVSYDPATKQLVTAEADGTAHPSRVVTNKGLAVDGKGTYEWAVRFIGANTGAPASTGGPR